MQLIAWLVRTLRTALFAAAALLPVTTLPDPVAALTLAPLVAQVARAADGYSLIIQVRDICSVRDEGNERITRYCDDPYVCDRANPGSCKPGPELQRKLDQEKREREAEIRQLEQQARELEAKQRELQRRDRALARASLSQNGQLDERRASGCATIRVFDRVSCVGSSSLSTRVYTNDPRRVPSTQYINRQSSAGTPGRAAAVSQPAKGSLRERLRFAMQIKPMVDYVNSLQAGDPLRRDMQNLIETVARHYQSRGVDTADVLKDVNNSLRPPPEPITNAPQVQAPEPVPQQPVASPPAAADVETKPRVSQKDEALCSYLLTLEQDRLNRSGLVVHLGVPVPDYCTPYLRSIGHERVNPSRMSWSLADEEGVRALVKEAQSLDLLPPGAGE